MADLFPLKHGINDWSETPLMMLPMVIQLIDNDDDRAWMTALYEKECRVMFRTAQAYSNQKADTEDIVSESCVHLIEHLDTIRGMESKKLSVYIVHTVRNTAINYLRKKQREKKYFEEAPDDDHLADPLHLENAICLREELQSFLQVVNTLPETQQAVLRMKYYLEMKDAEIAHQLGIAESSVRKYIERARKKLIQSLLVNKEAVQHE